ncbi:MAG TPA: hypothetical protein DCL95_03180 [Rhodospirillaceae bacterium]|nr:hypothetical protein [Rhodospirillaceae bacterium]HAE02365.1 hypothetical protein [Rhodospirillaceae bacterium]HAJ19055.1 hypothetical protein [Rhodospirillaceae bacterium]
MELLTYSAGFAMALRSIKDRLSIRVPSAHRVLPDEQPLCAGTALPDPLRKFDLLWGMSAMRTKLSFL